MRKIWEWLNGNKTLIGTASLAVLQSNYVEARVEPDLLGLLFNVAMMVTGIGGGHKIFKKAKNLSK